MFLRIFTKALNTCRINEINKCMLDEFIHTWTDGYEWQGKEEMPEI